MKALPISLSECSVLSLPPFAVAPASHSNWGEYAAEAAIAAALVSLAFYLRRRLRDRTGELQASENRFRTLFEQASVAIMEQDFTEVVASLDALRAQGVANLAEHLRAHPELPLELFRKVRVTAVNHVARLMMDARTLEEFSENLRKQTAQSAPASFPSELEAIWDGRLSLTRETRFRAFNRDRRHGVLHWAVPLRDRTPDWRRVLITITDVTELQVSEERYRALFDDAVEGVYETYSSGGFRRANPAMARMLGYDQPDELVALPPEVCAQFYVVSDRRHAFMAQLGDREVVFNFESELRRKDGSTIWISENVRAVRDETGKLLYLRGFVTDISARKRAETALRESEERYRTLFEHSPIAVLEFDARPTVAWIERLRREGVADLQQHFASGGALEPQLAPVVVNAAAVRLMGAKSKEELQQRFTEIFSAEANGETSSAVRRGLFAMWAGAREAESEMTLQALDGTVRRVHCHWWVPLINGRAQYEATQLAILDLTQARTAELELAAEREQLRVTLGAMVEGVVSTDPNGIIRFINPAACELTGWSEAAAIGRRLDEVCVFCHEKTRERVAPPPVSLPSGRVADLPPQTMLLRAGGGQCLVEGRCAPMHDGRGRAIGAVLLLRDITERSRLEAELARASKLESVGLLAGGIAHDFNNILSIVMGNLALAQLDAQLANVAGRWLQEAERGAMRARDLTQQLLTFAKGGEPVRAAVVLADVVRDAAEFVLHGATVRCEFDLSGDLWAANADKGQIGQVVQNLVINAMQAMPAGGVIRVTLRNIELAPGARPPLPGGRYLHLSIADAGCGIRPEHLARIFEPYFTTKLQGSGLGLATVYSIMKKHQGHIAVESVVGQGTTFHLWLPAAPIVPVEPAASNSPFDPMRGRILFMDDEEPIRDMASVLMGRIGLEVTTVADGAEVLREYLAARERGKPFDLVMMDLTVPGAMGGRDAMAELLKIDPQVRAIVSSGYSSDPVLADFRAHGFRAMVPKPYRVADLSRTLREVMNGK